MPVAFVIPTSKKNYNVPVAKNLKTVGVTVTSSGNPADCLSERSDIATGALYASKDIWENEFLSATGKIGYYYE